MTPAAWARVRGVLEEALELPPPEACAYLDAHCDPVLRAEVDSLLTAARVSDSFIDSPPFVPEMIVPPGTQIGAYTIESAAGYGGMGVVYRARDRRLGRTVAIKVLPLPPGDLDPLAEARTVSSLNHPNIVTVYDVLDYRCAPAIVMEFVEGRTLRDILADGKLDPARALHYARQIAGGLAASHEAGVLHRDLKPSNVIVRADGVAKVLDFGIASRMAGSEAYGPAAGTAGYISPEQAAGEHLDERADIYSFGALLREMLPASGTWRKCMAPSREARYGSMREVLAELDGPARGPRIAAIAAAAVLLAGAVGWQLFSRSGGTPAAPQSVERLASFDDGMAALFPSISPDGVQVAYATGGRLYIHKRGEAAGRALPVEGVHPAYSPDGASLAFRSEHDGGGIRILDTASGVVRKLTDGGFHPAWSSDGRGIVFSSEAFERVEERTTTTSELSIAEVTTGRVRLLATGTGDAIQPSWSPGSGGRIAFWSVDRGGRRAVWTVDASDGKPAVRLTDGKALDWNPVWSPDGAWLYWISNRSGSMNAWRVRVDPASGAAADAPEAVALPVEYAGFLSFSRAGTLSYAGLQPVSSIWKAALRGGGAPVRLTPRAKRILYPTPSPDGAWIAACAQAANENLVIFRPDGSDFRNLTSGSFRDRDPSWSPDGKTIAFGSNRGGEYQIWGVSPDGSGLRELARYPAGAFSPAWAPDGLRFAWFTRGFRPFVWEANGSAEAAALPGEGLGFRPSDWSPDGKSIAGILRGRQGVKVAPALYSPATRTYRRLNIACDSVRWAPRENALLCAAGRTVSRVDLGSGAVTRLLEVPNAIDNQFAVSPDGQTLFLAMAGNLTELWLSDERAPASQSDPDGRNTASASH